MRGSALILLGVAAAFVALFALVRATSRTDCELETVQFSRPKASKFGFYTEKYEYKVCKDLQKTDSQ